MGKCKYQSSWLYKTDSMGIKISEWLRKSDNEFEGLCILCEKRICVTKGLQSLNQHVETGKHRKNFSIKLGPLQLHLTGRPEVPKHNETSTSTLVPPSSTSTVASGTSTSVYPSTSSAYTGTSRAFELFSYRDVDLRAELLFSMKTVVANYSAASCDGLGDLFRPMFQDGVPASFSLSRSKLSYLITEALGPYFHQQLVNDVESTYYTVQFDETSNAEGFKELQVTVKYWSHKTGQVRTAHLETFFLGHATGEILSQHILQALENSNLSLKYILMLGCDGPNVNLKVHRLINEEVLAVRGSGLVHIGTCNIHIAHNAFLKGLEQFGEECSEIIINVFNFFHDYPSRWEDFSKIQADMNVPKKKFTKHVQSRWLTLKDSAAALIVQGPALEKYFLHFIPKNCSSRMKKSSYKMIVSFLKMTTYKAMLSFVASVAERFQQFTETFQKQEPLVHTLYSELKRLCLSLISRVCKSQVLEMVEHADVDHHFAFDNLLPVELVVVSSEVKEFLTNLPEKEVKVFMKNVQQHYIVSCKYLLKKTLIPSKSTILKSLSFLDPSNSNIKNTCQDIVKVASALPASIPTDILQDEWKLLRMETSEILPGQKIDDYWNNYITIKLACGKLKYPNVAKVIQSSLCLSHGSADVERGFSQSGRILTEDNASMSLRMLNARLNIQTGLKRYQNKPELVPVTPQLLSLGRGARASYHNYLENKKNEEQLKKEEEEELQKKLHEERDRELRKRKHNIDKLEKDLEDKKQKYLEKQKASEDLFSEAHSRLKKALDRKDIEGARLAEAMLEGVKAVKGQTSVMQKEAECIQKSLNKKKTSLITKFFKQT